MAWIAAQSGWIGTARNEYDPIQKVLFGWPSPEPNLGQNDFNPSFLGPESIRTSSLLDRFLATRDARRRTLRWRRARWREVAAWWRSISDGHHRDGDRCLLAKSKKDGAWSSKVL
ncbi:uncharacterized protein LOC101758877 [Setaria italica]|uniref:uncharacterized protein LOC101758877 n=1 Tax=Setaria italica TaxID=4555 RepID=UPI000BE4C17E|nr:uncharacterized protein LOC101758877 [Setaria italica]